MHREEGWLAEEKLVLEINSGSDLPNDATRQLFNYLRATNLQVGLLLHYGMKPRFYRVYCKPEERHDDRRGPLGNEPL